MDRLAFRALLNKYLEGNCTDEEERLIQQWYELIDDEQPNPILPADWERLEDRLWEKIQVQANLTETHSIPPRRSLTGRGLRWLAAASVLLALAGYGVYAFLQKPPANVNWLVNANNTSATKLVTLEDGSKVSLKPGSRIEYPRHFSVKSREVFLEGEAFFEVTKNPLRAFFVYNNNLVTEVLGTSFNIVIRNNKIEVEVKTGRVAVYENGKKVQIKESPAEENKIIITPNQKVIYDNSNRRFTTAIADRPVALNPPSSDKPVSFKFDETPLSDVLKAIESVYGIEVILENEKMKLCPFSGDLSQHDLYTKLDFICQAFHASYETKGVKIYINGGRECN